MAKTIATIGGTALAPGVSLNRRLYTPQAIAAAVVKAQERIGGGGLPLTMMTHHEAEDDSTRIVGKITSMTLGEDGSARFTADIADTDAGHTIAALTDSANGEPFLRSVSIRGEWEGKVRRVTAPDGRPAEQGDAITLHGLDFTKTPGVGAARIDAFTWAADGRNETTERVLITESVEGTVTVTEGNAPAGPPEGVLEVLAAFLGGAREADNTTPAVSKRGSGMTGAGRKWADPGYQADKKQRYDITSKAKAVTAWRFINQPAKAAKYSASQLKNVKARIRSALKGFGVSVSTEHAPGWGFSEAVQVTQEVAEFYGDPSRAGSWCVSASNGPVNLSLSSWSMDPADLDAILRAAADAACKALAALDPDMDGDVDVPGVGANSDTDDDAGSGETAPESETTGAADSGPGQPAEAGTSETETEAPVTTEATSTTPGGSGPSTTSALSPEVIAAIGEAVKAALPTPAAPPAAEPPAAPAAPATPAAAATEAGEDARLARLVAETVKALGITPPAAPPAAPPAPPAATQETTPPAAGGVDTSVIAAALKELGIQVPEKAAPVTEDQRVQAAVRETIQALVASGDIAVARGGIAVVDEHTMVPDGTKAGYTGEQLRNMPEDGFADSAGAALDVAIFGGRTDSRGRPLAAHTTG